MGAEALALRTSMDRRESDRLKQKAAADIQRIRDAAERIRRMTQIYRERQDGIRRDVRKS